MFFGSTWCMLHNSRLWQFGTKAKCWHEVRSQIDCENLHDRQGQWVFKQNKENKRRQFWHVACQNIRSEPSYVGINSATFLYRRHNAGEVAVQHNHAGRFLSHVVDVLAHGNANVGLFKRCCIVYTIAGNCDNFSKILKGGNNAHLLCGISTGKDDGTRYGESSLEGFVVHLREVLTRNDTIFGFVFWTYHPNPASNCERCKAIVACDHNDANPSFLTTCYGSRNFCPRRIFHPC